MKSNSILGLMVLSAAMSAGLSACGGGGGDSGSPGGPPLLSAPLALTSTNYTQAAQEVLASAFYLGNAGNLATGVQTSRGAAITDRAVAALLRLTPRLKALPTVATGASVTQTLPCSDGGNMSVTLDDVNSNSVVEAGDSLAIVANACVEGSETLNGRLGVRFLTLSGDLSTDLFSASMSMTLDQFSVRSAAGTSTGNGQLQVTMASTALNSTTSTVTVSQLSTTTSFGGTSSTSTLTDVRLQQVTRPSAAATFNTSISFDGQFASTALESRSLTLATVAPFVQSSTALYPGSGQATLTGAAGSMVRITAQNTSTVLIELDADGNGSYETSTTRAWNQLI